MGNTSISDEMAPRTPCCFLEFSDSDEAMQVATDNVESEVAKDSDAQFHVQMISSILEMTDETPTSPDPNRDIERPTEKRASNWCLPLPISRQDSEVLRSSKAVNHPCKTKVNHDGGTPSSTDNSSQLSHEGTEGGFLDRISEK